MPEALDVAALVASAEPWIIRQAVKRSQRSRLDHDATEDVISAGRLGAVIAAQRFDPTRGVKFLTFAAYWIAVYQRQATIQSELAVGMPSQLAGGKQRQLAIAGSDRADFASVAKAGMAMRRRAARLDLPIGGGDATLGEMLASPGATVEERLAELQLLRRAMRFTAQLPRRDRQIVLRRINGEDLAVIGRDLGISRERVRQLYQRALDRLFLLLSDADQPGVAAASGTAA